MSDLITITGNIATEPERRRTATGVPVTTFRLASSQRHFDRAKSEWVETSTNWYSVSAFRDLAEHVGDSLHKGERVILTGRLRLREWETAAKRGLSVEIDADAIGHDLRWGTSRYLRAARHEANEQQGLTSDEGSNTGDPGASWAAPTGGDWGAPAATSPPDAETPVREAPSDELPF